MHYTLNILEMIWLIAWILHDVSMKNTKQNLRNTKQNPDVASTKEKKDFFPIL